MQYFVIKESLLCKKISPSLQTSHLPPFEAGLSFNWGAKCSLEESRTTSLNIISLLMMLLTLRGEWIQNICRISSLLNIISLLMTLLTPREEWIQYRCWISSLLNIISDEYHLCWTLSSSFYCCWHRGGNEVCWNSNLNILSIPNWYFKYSKIQIFFIIPINNSEEYLLILTSFNQILKLE